MKRWNGWGREEFIHKLHPSSEQFIINAVGQGQPTPDAAFEGVTAAAPASALPEHPLVSRDPADRVRYARGQSLADWIALRSGQIGRLPDGVAFPTSDEDVRALLAYARQTGARLIPYGGGTSVVGHINPPGGEAPVLTVALERMNHLLALDEASQTAVFEAGVRGPDLEAALNARGYTLGHFPQSFEFSTLGGWIASRSVGTQCYLYGRIENLFLGGHVETPQGALDLPHVPASAAGPDLHHLVLGSEGRLGLITRATVRVRQLPRRDTFHAVFFAHWEAAFAALKEIVRSRAPVSMLRLSNAMETESTLQLSGKENFVKLAHNGLGLIGIGPERCLLIFGVTGEPALARAAYAMTTAIARRHGGLVVDPVIGPMWYKSRFTTPYLRNTLWERGYALDTLETALPWAKIPAAMPAIQEALRHALDDTGERTLVFAHLSHMYSDGASMYITYLYRRTADPAETLHRWTRLKTAASQQIVAHGGTISHQHGVGTDHAPYLAAEKGPLGMSATAAALRHFDPAGMMNPGKLII